MKIKKFYEPLFKVQVLCITDCGSDELKVYLKKKKINIKDFDCMDGFTAHLEELQEKDIDGGYSTYHVLWIKDKKQFYSLLHETIHLVWQVMEERGIKASDEIAAYCTEWWFKTLWSFINKK